MRVSNAFYVPGEQRAEKVNDLFGTIARRYDLINDLQSFGLHRRWKRRVVDLAAVTPGARALDLCCGTGDLALALARRGASVTGLDFSAPMLAVAARRRRGPPPSSARATRCKSPFPTIPLISSPWGMGCGTSPTGKRGWPR